MDEQKKRKIDIIALTSLVVATVSAAAAIIVVPEVRKWTRLDVPTSPTPEKYSAGESTAQREAKLKELQAKLEEVQAKLSALEAQKQLISRQSPNVSDPSPKTHRPSDQGIGYQKYLAEITGKEAKIDAELESLRAQRGSLQSERDEFVKYIQESIQKTFRNNYMQ